MRVDGTVYRCYLQGVLVVAQIVIHILEKVSTYENIVLNYNHTVPVRQHKVQSCGETKGKALISGSLANFDVSEPRGSSSFLSNGLYILQVG